MVARVYVEGGGESNHLRTLCRKGFSEFFRKAGLAGRMPRVIASGSRREVYDDFVTAHRKAEGSVFPVLLVDSETAVSAQSPWDHLMQLDHWDKPQGATDDHAHLMVQCMEAWFVADRHCLERYFGQGFTLNALAARNDVENIPKNDLMNGLRDATRHSLTKGEYEKGRDSFAILERIDPNLVRQASPYANRLIVVLLKSS